MGLFLVFGSDAFGESLKDSLVKHCQAKGHQVEDLGTGAYYEIAGEVAKRVGREREGMKEEDEVKGLLFCGTGMGVGMVANKFEGVRAATCESVFTARCSRAINNANVLCLGGTFTSVEDACEMCDAWLGQEHGKPPADPPPPWWSAEVEHFLANKWPEVAKVEASALERRRKGRTKRAEEEE